jgi:hypothetical protein
MSTKASALTNFSSEVGDRLPTTSYRLIMLSIPRLNDARCVGQSRLFDPDPQVDRRFIANAHRAAAQICSECPARTDCHNWVEQLPADQRPTGVVAGWVWVAESPPGRRQHRAANRRESSLLLIDRVSRSR